MGKNILVAVVGAGAAHNTPYAVFEPAGGGKEYGLFGGRVEESCYPFLAADKLLLEEDFDMVFLIGTGDSRWGLLCQNAAEEYRRGRDLETPWPGKEKIDIRKERKEAESFLGKCLGREVRISVIKEGRTAEETDQNMECLILAFSEIFQEAAGEINITLDVSNGLRSIPMYVQAVIDYFSALESRRDCTVKVLYGMYEASWPFCKEDGLASLPAEAAVEGGIKVAPMLRMDGVTQIRAWASAVREFYANGSVMQLLGLLQTLGKESCGQGKTWSQECYRALSDFSFAMNSNKLDLFQKSIREMQRLQEKYGGIEDAGSIPIYILKILSSILDDLTGRFGVGEEEGGREKYAPYMFSIAQWYFEQERFGDAVIALQEGMVTFVMEEYPKECTRLLQKNLLGWHRPPEKLGDKLFDSSVRKVIRKHVFERDDKAEEGMKKRQIEEWREWRKEYDYVCRQIRNSAMLMSYQGKGLSQEECPEENMISIEAARGQIKTLMEKMEEERSCQDGKKKMLEMRLQYLINLNEFDVFISYRRSYGSKEKKDGFLLALSIRDYLMEKGWKVFMDVPEMKGRAGKFSEHLRKELYNSKCCLVILGEKAYQRDFSEADEYYKEIITAVKDEKKVFVACMKGFLCSEEDVGKGVFEQKELMDVAEKYQRIGSSDTTEWEDFQAMKLRERIEEEIHMFLRGEEKKFREGFVNYSNHPSHLWGERQREAAQRYGEIVDLPFPNIPPDLSERELDELAQREAGNILSQNPKCVLCQGEFTFTYRIINRLKAHQIKVVAACSERVATEKNVDGKTVKAAEFVFQGFREY